MFKDELLEKIFSYPQMQGVPIGHQSTVVKAFEEILEDILEVNPYATVSELFADGLSAIDVSTEF